MMKTLLKTKIAMLILLIGLTFSCKKNDTTTLENQAYADSTKAIIDTVGPDVDTMTTDTIRTTKTDTVKK